MWGKSTFAAFIYLFEWVFDAFEEHNCREKLLSSTKYFVIFKCLFWLIFLNINVPKRISKCYKIYVKKIMIFQNNNPCIFCCAKFKYKENMSNCCAPIKNS